MGRLTKQREEEMYEVWAIMFSVLGKQHQLTSDSLYDACDVSKHPLVAKYAAAVFRRAKKKGWITKTDRFALSMRPSQASKPIPIWERASQVHIAGVQ